MYSRETLYLTAKECLGKDLVNDPSVPNEVQCAASVNAVFRKAFGENIGGGASTKAMYEALLQDNRFEQVNEPAYSDIIISPTSYSSKNAPHGHVGIVAKFGVLSNNSLNGLWSEVYTIQSWEENYRDRLGFPVHFFRLVEN